MPAPVFIIGSPRSGTTWLAKMFDSHPSVLYRHEPDSTNLEAGMPHVVRESDIAAYSAAAVEHFVAMGQRRDLRVVGKRPLFRKDYRRALGNPAWQSMVLSLHLLSAVRADRRGDPQVPDLMRSGAESVLLVKSVIALGRAALYRHALPDLRMVLIMRHPCAFVASELRGTQIGKLKGEFDLKALCVADETAQLGLSEVDFDALSHAEKWAWYWAVMNEKAYRGLTSQPQTYIVRHEDLCLDPVAHARELFTKVDLDWAEQSHQFLRASTTQQGDATYYGVIRDSRKEATKWKDELSVEVIDRVLSILDRTSLAGRYADI